jgi:hypothetical protein
LPGQVQLIRLTASVKSYSGDPDGNSEGDVPVLASQLRSPDLAWAPTATNEYVGEAYVTMPAGSTRELPISVSGVASSSFDVHTDGKNVKILANGIDLSTNTPEFCVGQQVVFTLDGLPPYSNHITHWKFPDKYVNEKWQSINPDTFLPYGSVNYRINSDLLTNLLSVTNWFINGQGGIVSVGTSLQFNNAQTVSLAAKGNFKVYRPQANLTSGSASIGPVEVESTGLTIPASKLTSGGCVFGATVNSLSFSGKANWVQLINRQLAGDGLEALFLLQNNTFGNYSLDNDPFYNTQDGDVGTAPVHTTVILGTSTNVRFGFNGDGDAPGIGILATSFVSITDAFKTYLVFNPDPDNSANIWVTLGKVTWGWDGYAAFDIPTGKWLLTTGSTNAPAYSDTDEFPTWTTRYSNSR